MTTVGFDRPLYILPLRSSRLVPDERFGWNRTLTIDQMTQIAAAKQATHRSAIDGPIKTELCHFVLGRKVSVRVN